MATDGKQLEGLVSWVEERLVPPGFSVKTNRRVVDDEGHQIAEFDVEITGKVGSTSIAWLIECRDRPGAGAAPGSWIEQLVGRRTRFRFNKVTAVSTTGFAPGAVDFAREQGIELREVNSLSPTEFANWLHVRIITYRHRRTRLHDCTIVLDPAQPEAHLMAAEAELATVIDTNTALLTSSSSGANLSIREAFAAAVEAGREHFEHFDPGLPQRVHLIADYTATDHFVIGTSLGPVKVQQLQFLGEITVELSTIPLVSSVEYRTHDVNDSISQVARFGAVSIGDMEMHVELRRLEQTGSIHVVMRRAEGDV